jgi:hypothetical protein
LSRRLTSLPHQHDVFPHHQLAHEVRVFSPFIALPQPSHLARGSSAVGIVSPSAIAV